MVVLPKTPLRRTRLTERKQDAESLLSFNPQPAAQADRRPVDLFKDLRNYGERQWPHQASPTTAALHNYGQTELEIR